MNNKELIASVNEAMESRELTAFYQPQYDAITNKVVSAEALVRWVRKDGTIVPPAQFIPELELTDAIVGVDWYMVKEVCETLAQQIEEKTAVPIAVNFSRWHVNEKDFVEKLNAIVDSFYVPHNMLEVEITESALIDEQDNIKSWIKQVREAGYTVAIDDFGSGLSSLQFVKEMPIDVLKIDKSLLSENCEDEKERIVLESIFYFAHRLKMTTVTEGVETGEQLGFLRTCSCEKIQGFLFAKPMPKDDYLKICRGNTQISESEDILEVQAPASATQLLLDAVFMKYPLVIFSNLTRNSFYMMAYENFSATSCPSTGVFDELIVHGAATMHPEDKEAFASTFSRENLLKEYGEGKKSVSLMTRQLGDDGVYRKVETTDYFVKHPSVDDVLVISLCDNRE
ncbi:MAG: EAL domain-containing protein [Lachnospiraceae bacterium]|nr:EAL domain-containing protein [Lachnospiraceae bacterium]